MLIKAYAKINLSLDVTGKRDDGYHLLSMVMQNIELYDLLTIDKVNHGINISCNKGFVPTDERNIANKAAKIFLERYKINKGVNIKIIKNIPVAAGLAGGSADAAAVLKAMRNIFEVDTSDEQLMDLGLKLGADVPYCIKGGTALCEGIGEIITPLAPFKGHILVLVKPPFGVSTKEVYGNLDISKVYKHPDKEKILSAVNNGNLLSLCYNMKNVLENVTIKKHGSIKSIKQGMLKDGAVGVMMSGSGPSTYGFFDDIYKAQKCFENMKKKYNEVFLTRTI